MTIETIKDCDVDLSCVTKRDGKPVLKGRRHKALQIAPRSVFRARHKSHQSRVVFGMDCEVFRDGRIVTDDKMEYGFYLYDDSAKMPTREEMLALKAAVIILPVKPGKKMHVQTNVFYAASRQSLGYISAYELITGRIVEHGHRGNNFEWDSGAHQEYPQLLAESSPIFLGNSDT